MQRKVQVSLDRRDIWPLKGDSVHHMKNLAAFLTLLFVSCVCVRTQAQNAPPVLKPASSTSVPGQSKESTSAADDDSLDVDEDSVIRTATSLISVPAVVLDRNGRYIPNLHKEDFRIYEDGVEQDVAYFAPVEKPFTVALMLDASGSTQSQLAQLRAAANAFISQLRPNDRLLIMTFDGSIHMLAEPTDVSAIRKTRLHIPEVTDGTVLYDAVDFVLNTRLAHIQGRKAIILFTDGVDMNSRSTYQRNVRNAEEQDVLIYTVQYNTLPQLPARLAGIANEKAREKVKERMLKKYAVSESYMRELAGKTGGRFYRAEGLADTEQAFAAITGELGMQYSLGYYPKGSVTAGPQRSIKVQVRQPNLVVRARDSYSTNPSMAKQPSGGGN
jgi:Ca-activated chloride channel family protein